MNLFEAASEPAAVTSLFLQHGMTVAPDEGANECGIVVYTKDGPCMNKCCVDECEDDDDL